MKPDLRVVPPAPTVPVYDTAKGRRRLEILRAQLMKAAVRYVTEGKDGSRNERLRTASSLSGIPITLIATNSGEKTAQPFAFDR